MRPSTELTGQERTLGEKEIIVSKTDLTGKLTYANKTFLNISGYTEEEILGVQHNLIRHPDMPRAIFKFLWDRLEAGEEVFAYVINQSKNGDHYWVLAHVTPSKDPQGNVVGYHSNRRAVDKELIKNVIIPVYASLADIENSASSPREGLEASTAALYDFVDSKGGNYDKWIFSL
ncbi:PAS domain-containing protein [Sneathiella sp. P13V-1]|uniref:PAS domain-containing protein n=1 Tax=Sneathiella sp. P13V-1 TaxID=2697366 RepID=UPI00187B8155|nr:PAS domain-containing protein [Sneathiella sp. P13V-1]MBE7635580.1 PAS domain-containing protein [Sneathiella sp. P13V-1]